MNDRGWENFGDFCAKMAAEQKQGRPALRRRWIHLRALAADVLVEISDSEAEALIGKVKAAADPEENDVKALLSYAVGRGLLKPEQVRDALQADTVDAPLYWLGGLSGKAFGESIAPRLCAYWLQHPEDQWVKMKGTDYFDITWTPAETRSPVRIEIKASSESPAFRFQQIRDPRYTTAPNLDYDALLCLGVTSATLEFWFIPSQAVVGFIEDGTLVNQHGGGKMRSNTYWFSADVSTRKKLLPYGAEATAVRATALRFL